MDVSKSSSRYSSPSISPRTETIVLNKATHKDKILEGSSPPKSLKLNKNLKIQKLDFQPEQEAWKQNGVSRNVELKHENSFSHLSKKLKKNLSSGLAKKAKPLPPLPVRALKSDPLLTATEREKMEISNQQLSTKVDAYDIRRAEMELEEALVEFNITDADWLDIKTLENRFVMLEDILAGDQAYKFVLDTVLQKTASKVYSLSKKLNAAISKYEDATLRLQEKQTAFNESGNGISIKANALLSKEQIVYKEIETQYIVARKVFESTDYFEEIKYIQMRIKAAEIDREDVDYIRQGVETLHALVECNYKTEYLRSTEAANVAEQKRKSAEEELQIILNLPLQELAKTEVEKKKVALKIMARNLKNAQTDADYYENAISRVSQIEGREYNAAQSNHAQALSRLNEAEIDYQKAKKKNLRAIEHWDNLKSSNEIWRNEAEKSYSKDDTLVVEASREKISLTNKQEKQARFRCDSAEYKLNRIKSQSDGEWAKISKVLDSIAARAFTSFERACKELHSYIGKYDRDEERLTLLKHQLLQAQSSL